MPQGFPLWRVHPFTVALLTSQVIHIHPTHPLVDEWKQKVWAISVSHICVCMCMCDVHSPMYVRRHICHARVLSRFNHVQLRVLYGLQSTRPLCPRGSQARILEWVAMPSSRGLNPCLLPLLHWQAGSLPLYTRITLLSYKSEGNTIICDIMDEPGRHYAMWNKPDRKTQILHNLTYICRI